MIHYISWKRLITLMFNIGNAPLAADMIDQAAVARAPAPADSERRRAALAAALAAELRAVFAPEDAPALALLEPARRLESPGLEPPPLPTPQLPASRRRTRAAHRVAGT